MGCIRFELFVYIGVVSAKTGDYESKKITVIGKVDPVELRQKVEEKIKRKVDLISPENGREKHNQLSGGGEQMNKQQKQQTAAVQDKNKVKKVGFYRFIVSIYSTPVTDIFLIKFLLVKFLSLIQ